MTDVEGNLAQNMDVYAPATAAGSECHLDALRFDKRVHQQSAPDRVRGVHRTRWVSLIATSSGALLRQTGSTCGQRGPKRQPGIGSSGSGIRPGIAYSRSVPPSSGGIDAIRPSV